MKSKKEKRKGKEIYKDFYNKYQNYHRNLSGIKVNRLKYDEIMNDMYGVSSVVVKDAIMGNADNPGRVWDHYLVEKKDRFLLEKAALLYDTVIVNEVLNNIADDEMVDTTTECYAGRDKKHGDIVCNHNRGRPTACSDMNRAVLSQLKK